MPAISKGSKKVRQPNLFKYLYELLMILLVFSHILFHLWVQKTWVLPVQNRNDFTCTDGRVIPSKISRESIFMSLWSHPSRGDNSVVGCNHHTQTQTLLWKLHVGRLWQREPLRVSIIKSPAIFFLMEKAQRKKTLLKQSLSPNEWSQSISVYLPLRPSKFSEDIFRCWEYTSVV